MVKDGQPSAFVVCPYPNRLDPNTNAIALTVSLGTPGIPGLRE